MKFSDNFSFLVGRGIKVKIVFFIIPLISILIVLLDTFSIFSLLLSEWTLRNDVDANFYLLPTRIWELLVGSTAALILKKNQQCIYNLYEF